MTKAIYNFHWNCGRMGDVSGTFVADKSVLESSINRKVYFGEILGKHSEVYGTLDEGDVTLVTEDQEFIKKFEEVLGEGWSSGYNPLDYLEETDEED